jgi:transposase
MPMVNKNRDLSQLSVRQLRTRRRQLAAGLPDVEALLHGSLVDQGRRCGKEGCRCTRGELHGPYTYLATGRTRGRNRLLYVPAALVELVRRRVDQTTQVQTVLAEISAINAELLVRRELD